LRKHDLQLQLFALLAAQTVKRQERQLALTESQSRRDIVRALGQVGNQLALALWRGDELAASVRRAPLCSVCQKLVLAPLQQYDGSPTGRLPPPSRYLPVLGSVC
jgi:hypothetical protein